MWGQRLSFWLTTAVTPSERIVMPYSASAIDIVRCWWVMMDELGVFAQFVERVDKAGQVHVAERGLHLVHHVERARAAR